MKVANVVVIDGGEDLRFTTEARETFGVVGDLG